MSKLNRQKNIKNSYKVNFGDIVHYPSSLINRPVSTSPKDTQSSNNLENNSNERKKNIIELSKFMESQVIYEDCDMLIINKPPGLSTQDGFRVNYHLHHIFNEWKDKEGRENLKIIHRLDKLTSGCLILSKNRQNAKFLSEKFRNHEVLFCLLIIYRLKKHM